MRDRRKLWKLSAVLLFTVGIMLVFNAWLDVQATSKDFISYTKEEALLYGIVWPENAVPDALMNSYLRHNGVSFWYVVKLVGAAAFVALGTILCWLRYQDEEKERSKMMKHFGEAMGPLLFLAAVLYVLWVVIPSQTWNQSVYAMDYYLLHMHGIDLYRVPGHTLLESSARLYLGVFSFVCLGLCVLLSEFNKKANIRRRNIIMTTLSVIGMLLISFVLRIQSICLVVTMIFLMMIGILLRQRYTKEY